MPFHSTQPTASTNPFTLPPPFNPNLPPISHASQSVSIIWGTMNSYSVYLHSITYSILPFSQAYSILSFCPFILFHSPLLSNLPTTYSPSLNPIPLPPSVNSIPFFSSVPQSYSILPFSQSNSILPF